MAKKTMKFHYSICTTWLREKAAELTAQGFKIEVKENAVPTQSFLLKIASSKIEAELVVWETGATSMIVVNLSTNDYDLDRSDIVLTSEQFESELGVFFGLIK
jgi:hypothetical protein